MNYSEAYCSVQEISSLADQMAKQGMDEQVQGVGGEVDLVLELVKAVHRDEPCDLRRLLQLDTTDGSSIVLRLIHEGVLQAEARLGGRD